MFASQRINLIKQILLDEKQVNITSLALRLNVSDVTVRKDLDVLEKEGFLKKVHGGAILSEDETQNPIEFVSNVSSYAEKKNIAGLAANLLQDSTSLFLGQGTTCKIFASDISRHRNITVVTNNIDAVAILMNKVNSVQILGGDVQETNGTAFSTGPKTCADLENMFINQAFISADCVDIRAGITTNNLYVHEITRKIMEISKNVILLADKTKFDHQALHQIAPLDGLTAVVTNEGIPQEYKDYFFKKNIKLLTAYGD